jgi:hypothetical protein
MAIKKQKPNQEIPLAEFSPLPPPGEQFADAKKGCASNLARPFQPHPRAVGTTALGGSSRGVMRATVIGGRAFPLPSADHSCDRTQKHGDRTNRLSNPYLEERAER